MSNVSMINGHIDEPKGLTTGKAVSMIDEYLEEPNSINKEWVECMRLCKQALLENVNLKADKEALIAGQESLMKCIAKKKETIAELDIQLENSEAFNKKLMQDLHSYHDFNIDRIKRVKDIAFKEFAERLKKEATIDEDSTWWIANIDIDNLVEEMTEGKSNDKAFWEDTH